MPCTTAGGTATGVNKCGGDLFLPVDSSTMGAGAGPNGGFYSPNRATIHLHGGVTPWISDGTNDQWVSPASSSEQYPAGVSTRYVPDMWYNKSGTEITACYGYIYCFSSSGTPGLYQGADKATPVPTGFVADAPSASTYPSNNPGNGRMTFYYTNQQTARLMFYHDHSDGITRLNVYSGLVAGYLLHDTQEGNVMVAAGVRSAGAPNTPTAQEKVLVIQDKTFVGSIVQMQMQDPTWLTAGTDPSITTSQTSAWGGYGSLWFPHVYMPNQNPGLTTVNSTSPGATPAGRWDYGPWFWPAVNTETYKPVPNPLYKRPCLAGTINNSCEYKDNPGTPNVSAAPEAFSDSMVVNGVLFPIMHVAKKVYRLQLLNGSNDRTLSLSLFYSKTSATPTDPNNVNYVPNLTDPFNAGCTPSGKTTLWTNPATDKTPNCGDAGEVQMVPAIKDTTGLSGTAGLVYPDQLQQQQDGLVPDMRRAGPDLVELSSEGGILPDAAIFPASPIGFEFNNQSITLGNVKEHALILGPAQRADVLVDLTNVPGGATLILYNDAPAPFPGWDPRWYYQTGHADQTSTGGAPTILPGYAPNTQTIMQIKVDQSGTSPSIYDPVSGNLNSLLVTAIHNDYKASQDAPVVPQVEYNAALGTNTQTNVFPALGDSTFPVVSTGVSTITVDAAGLARAANVGTPQVLIGDQISATTLEASSAVVGGNGNGARGVPVMSTSSGLNTVTPNPAVTYLAAPTVTSISPAPTGTDARVATIKPVLAGSGDIATITVNQDANNAGYTATPSVVETGTATSRVPLVATAVLARTHIASFTLTNDSLAFTNTPNVSITGPRSTTGGLAQTATAVLTATPLRSIGVTSGGSYTLAPVLTINGGATATAILSTSVAAITVTSAGTCTFSQAQNASSTYFQISLTGGGIGGATPVAAATASSTINASGTAASGSAAKLQSIRLLLGGAGYTTNPTVVITPVGITCTALPTAVARLAAGPITSVVVNTFGSFTADPIITASTTYGSGAVFAPVLQPTSIASINLTGTTVNDFTGTPTVSLDIPSPISVTAVLAPTSVALISIVAGTGLGYSTPPGVAIDPPSAGAPAATAVVNMATSHLAFTILDPGFGYTVGSTVTVNLSGGTTATATVGTGTLQSITVTNPGTGYLSAPSVALLYPDGTLDTTHAVASLTSLSTNIVYHSTGIQELFDLDYARMNATMSSEVPFTAFNNQSTLPWSSVDSPTEIVNTNLPNALGGIGGSQVEALPDGTQIWRFTHNGVDTHFIHFHMFNVQILAVLGWDGVNQVLPAYDMGWRDTVQMDQLTTIYVAIKPIVPIVPWQIPNSLRPLDPQTNMFAANNITPITTQDPMMAAFDPSNTPVVAFNQLVNFGWEYMFHCHILGHEEADMMRPIPVGVVLTSPTALTTNYVAVSGSVGAHVDVTFTDNSINETGFILQRRGSASESWITVAAATRPASTWDNIHQLVIDQGLSTGSTGTLTDSVPVSDRTTFASGNSYQYQVIAVDAIGTQNLGTFPSTTVASDPSNIVFVQR